METRVPHPVEVVFAYLADPRHRAEWQSATAAVEMHTEGAPGRGTRWREKAIGIGMVEFEIVRYEPNETWAEYGTSRYGSGRVTLHFLPHGGQTRLLTEVDLRPRGAARLATPLLRLLVPLAIRSDLRRASRLIADR